MTDLNILIVDDEKRIREELIEFLTGSNHSVFAVSKPSEAFEILKKNPIDIAVVDINLPEKSGLTLLKEIKDFDNDIEVLIITGYGDMEKAINAMRNGAADFFNKPVRLNDVMKAIERTQRYINLNRKFNQVQSNYDHLLEELNNEKGLEIIGQSDIFKKVMEKVKIAAEFDDSAVLISGETGTGKELTARIIHTLSARKKFLFYPVNCSAIPENLFESEFFGYLKGSFTSAVRNKPGFFEIADKGTLFLDEIGDMSTTMQAKLLRITEDGKVHRLGSNSDILVNVRIIAATNSDIKESVLKGEFRQDLFHRISTLHINLPPLRERKDDIPLLVDYFIRTFSKKTGKKIIDIENTAMNLLLDYHFPGNVRELKNILERAVMLCKGSRLTHKCFSMDSLQLNQDKDLINDSESSLNLAQLEKNAIVKALQKTNNNKLKAAKLLNITWQSLERRIIKYNL